MENDTYIEKFKDLKPGDLVIFYSDDEHFITLDIIIGYHDRWLISSYVGRFGDFVENSILREKYNFIKINHPYDFEEIDKIEYLRNNKDEINDIFKWSKNIEQFKVYHRKYKLKLLERYENK